MYAAFGIFSFLLFSFHFLPSPSSPLLYCPVSSYYLISSRICFIFSPYFSFALLFTPLPSSPFPLILHHSPPLLFLSGQGFNAGSAHRGSGLVMQPGLERCFPASLPAVTRCDFFLFTPSRGPSPLSPVKDGAPDDPPRSPPPVCRLSAVGVRRCFTDRTESHREGG